MQQRVVAGVLALMVGVAGYAGLQAAPVNTVIDPVTTASVTAAVVNPAPDPKGSAAFRSALALLSDEPAAAFVAAEALDDAVERQAIQWAAIYFNAGALDIESVERFAADAPGFADASLIRTRIEQALGKSEPAASAVIAALGGEATPNTIGGQIMLAAAYLAAGDKNRATSLATSLWIDNFLTQEQETEVLEKLGALLDRDAHWARAMHLMMHDRARGSERLIPYLSEEQQSLVVARAAVSRNDADAKARLDAVDASMQANPVFIFSRAQRARQFELWESAVDWLSKAPDVVPDAAEWWYERRALVRKLLDVGEPELAYRAAADYDTGPEGRLVEAHFHAGWIALAFLDDAARARTHFSAMVPLSTLPDSITQANYWLGRANVALGDPEAARSAFEAAAQFGTVYYGQLARTELGEHGVEIRPLPEWQQSEALFDATPVVRAVRLLAANGKAAMAVPLLRHFGAELSNGSELLLAARLAQEIGAHHLAISIANAADQRGTPLDPYSFPKAGLPDDATLVADRAAVYAITRQESMFQVDAISSAGARGLMQLMPGTAQDVARKIGVDYSPSRLTSDGAYNALLGSHYLQTQLERYDGSLVLAAAAYNAGPGNANKWIRAYGDPRLANVDPVIWIELIPFQETRTYVKRVLGNYLVYRERLGREPVSLQQALRTIE